MSILNVAGMGRFSSDRTTKQYAEEIWNARPVPVEFEGQAGPRVIHSWASASKPRLP
jgi:starch phosphorylase